MSTFIEILTDAPGLTLGVFALMCVISFIGSVMAATLGLGGQDLAQAEYHYLRSARSGSFIGMHKLGSFYRDRAGKPREALKWWSHAIRKGLFNMAYEINRLYHDGLLRAEDAEATALAWYIVAVEHDTDHAKPKVAAMRNRLGSDRVREAARHAAAIRAELGLQSPPRAAP